MIEVLTKQALLNLVGKELGVSDWLKVDQRMINDFADVTLDQQFIHINPEKAALTPLGGTIAHGFLSLSLLSHFAGAGFGFNLDGASMSLNYGFDKVRFVSPVLVGTKIRAQASLISVDEKKAGKLLVKQHVIVNIKDKKEPALIADWLTMFVF